MKTNLLFVLFACAMGCHALHAASKTPQESFDIGKDVLFFHNTSLINSWVLSSNPAGLAFNKKDYISRVQSQLGFSSDHIRRATDPEETLSLRVSTESIHTLGNVVVEGVFGYQNQQYENIHFNSIMDFRNQIIYGLGDTIVGKQRQEGYYLSAKAAYPFLDGLVMAGIGAEYESAVGAKMRDPRNLNTIARFRAHPGLILNQDRFSFGINGGIIIEKNLTSIRVELEEYHSLYNFLGMGHYSAILNIRGGQSVRYEGKGFITEAQAQVKGGQWLTFHKINYLNLATTNLTGVDHQLIDGITDHTQLSYVGKWLKQGPSNLHKINLEVQTKTLRGTEIKQVLDGRYTDGYYVPVLRTVREIKDKHIVDNHSGELVYQLSALGSQRPFAYQFSVSTSVNMHRSGHYPLAAYGQYQATSALGYLQYQHFLSWGEVNIDPLFGAGVRRVLDADKSYQVAAKQFVQIPEANFRYFSEDYYMARFGLMLSTSRFSFPGVEQVFLNIDSHYAVYPNVSFSDNYNISLLFSLGMVF